jgi:hypothetical protein
VIGPTQDPGRLWDAVVEDQVGLLPRPSGRAVQLLAREVATDVAFADGLLGAEPGPISDEGPAQGLPGRDPQKDPELPAVSELRAKQEDAVEHQDGAPRSLLGRVMPRSVCRQAEHRRAKPARSGRSQRVEHVPAERAVVEGVEEVPVRRERAPAAPLCLRPVESVEADAERGPPESEERVREVVGQLRLPAASGPSTATRTVCGTLSDAMRPATRAGSSARYMEPPT